MSLIDDVMVALARVIDPEIHRPVTELGMVRSVDENDGVVRVGLDLTVPGCPMKDTLRTDVIAQVGAVDGVTDVVVELGVMAPEQLEELKVKLRGAGEPVVPFAQPGSLTRVIAVASGKGGVGKSSITANLAVALAARGLKVGVIDADVHGFSIPRMLGVDRQPTKVDDMLMPPTIHGVQVVSIGMFVPPGQPVVWRGPILHRAMQQFLVDVYWGDLDVLLLDLPPGTGDIAITLAQLLPSSELLVVTTPQTTAAEVAERAGAMAAQTGQKVLGVVENMSWMDLPDGTRMEVFGSGGGDLVARRLTTTLGLPVEVLARVPLDTKVREGSDVGAPVVLTDPESSAAAVLIELAASIATTGRGLQGRHLPLTPLA
jgi:ATP-binding protein involved in chromosome partitioning